MGTDGEISGRRTDLAYASVMRWILDEVNAAARRYRLSGDERSELRQVVSLRVVERLSRFRWDSGSASLETWVRRHAVWGVADYWRQRLRRTRRESTIGDEVFEVGDGAPGDPAEGALIEELAAALRTCLERLTPAQRERILAAEAARGTDVSQSDVARRFGISRDTLKESLQAARVALRRCLTLRGFSPVPGLSPPPDGRGAE